MEILHIHMKGEKLDTPEQLEIYKHMKTRGNNIVNEQTQLHHTYYLSTLHTVSYTHLDVYKRQIISIILLT